MNDLIYAYQPCLEIESGVHSYLQSRNHQQIILGKFNGALYHLLPPAREL